MLRTTFQQRRAWEQQAPEALAQQQLAKLNRLLATILPQNRLYAEKLAGIQLPLTSLDQLAELPYTYKDELAALPHEGEFATNLTYPLDHYTRYHRTSGTRGRPIAVLDTPSDWHWWLEVWQYVLDAAEVAQHDRVFMAFSFGPFIGFWSAHDACVAREALVIPGGGLTTKSRLELIRSTKATVVFTTPSYALHMAEVGLQNSSPVGNLGVKKIIVAGEPGGSVPATRQRIEEAWQAKLIDHAGASEIGPWGYGDAQGRGLRIVESDFIAEFHSVENGQPAVEGELAELVLTTLGRNGSPVIRYRTGDLVRPSWNAPGDNRFVLLEGGVLGRADDMLVIRGVNVFPSSIEQILLSFPEVVEWRLTAHKIGAMDSIMIEVEDRLGQPDRVADELQLRLGLKVEVRCAALGSLPRFEGKGKRFIDERHG